jgi:hypothetical protein
MGLGLHLDIDIPYPGDYFFNTMSFHDGIFDHAVTGCICPSHVLSLSRNGKKSMMEPIYLWGNKTHVRRKDAISLTW